jgi:cytochrome b561
MMRSNVYSSSQKALHWLLFVLVLGLYGLTLAIVFSSGAIQTGISHGGFTYLSDCCLQHLSFGVLFCVLSTVLPNFPHQ